MPPKSDKEKKKTTSRPDPFIGSKTVIGLTSHNFSDFVPEKDIALVMFYDPADAMCEWSKKHFLKAAKTTIRENHAYLAVNCTEQEDLCATEGIKTYPSFKMYSRGKVFTTYDKPKEFIYHTMKKFVENAPIIDEPQRPKRPC